MTYGLDMTEVRYETDHQGNRLKATIPFSMFSALTEFWIAARRAQTAGIEAKAKPGQFKGSLQAHIPSGDADQSEPAGTPATPLAPSRQPTAVPANRHDRHWQQLIEKLPDGPPDVPPLLSLAAALPPAPPAITESSQKKLKHPPTFYAREFCAPVPDEVSSRVNQGIYFLRAWREYRELTYQEVAELLGKTVDTVRWHERGHNQPQDKLLATYADIFDCKVEQLTVKPGSNTQPWLSVVPKSSKKANVCTTPPAQPRAPARAPDDTDYPDAVLAHLLAGKSPMTAWRLYRGMTLKDLAEQYGPGTRTANLKTMEDRHLKKKTVDRLCEIFHCKPAQLLRPEGMEVEKSAESPASRRISEAALMMGAGR